MYNKYLYAMIGSKDEHVYKQYTQHQKGLEMQLRQSFGVKFSSLK